MSMAYAVAPNGSAPGGFAPTGPGAPGYADQLDVHYAHDRAWAEVGRWRRNLIMRSVSLGVTFLILVVLKVWQVFHGATMWSGWPFWALFGVSVGLSLLTGAYAVWRYLQSHGRAEALTAEPPLVFTRAGVAVTGQWLPWPEVAGLAARSSFVHGDQFVVTAADGRRFGLPLDLLEVAPSTLDGSARAFSGFHRGVDFSRMDN